MNMPQCPQCGKDFVRRSQRQGIVEHLLSIAYVYPFRCQLCTHRFTAFQWGKRYSKQEVDRREYERISTWVLCTLSWSDASGDGMVTDISVAGCGVETDASVPKGALVQLQLHPPDVTPPIVIDAAVVRSRRAKNIGLQFLRIQTAEQERLREFVHALLAARSNNR